MPRTIKAFQFWVKPTVGTTAAVSAAIADGVAELARFEFTQNGKTFLADSLSWNNAHRVLTGTVYLLRNSGLPAAVKNGQVSALPIEDDTDLGEPMCFAFHPEVGAALVHYAHTGPRHSAIAAIAARFMVDVPFDVQPVIREDMLARLREKRFFRGIEFSLSDPRGAADLRALGGSVDNAVSMLDDLGGVNVKVEISMGHSKGEGMRAQAVRRFAERLARVAAQNVGGSQPVALIKVRGSDGEDAPVEELDLLKAREEIELEVGEIARTLDAPAACRRLRAALVERLDRLRALAGD